MCDNFFFFRLYWADSGLYSVRCVDLETFQVDVIYENVRQMVTFFGISRYQVMYDVFYIFQCIHTSTYDQRKHVFTDMCA